MRREPARLELLLTGLAFRLFGKRVYGDFANRLPLRGSERVLDFGCGMGTVAYYAAKRLPEGRITCLDVSARRLNACKKTLRGSPNAAFLLADASALEKDAFDVAYCHFVLHDLSEEELKAAVPALARSVTPGGKLMFREPLHPAGKLSFIKRFMEENGLSLMESRITDVPLMGNALESVYERKLLNDSISNGGGLS